MAQVSLRSYCDEVRGLIEAGSFDEAMAIGRHILQYYPKHLESYRLLGEVCLGKGLTDEATDLFLRVLSVDPENVAARIGLSSVYEAKGDMDSAVLQMREAFDLAPSVARIRAELYRLLRKQLGGEVPKLKLTRRGLGRIYLRGGLYTQAADEFETLLREQPDQIDVEVSLAEALWRDGQRIRSIEVCQSILNKLPYCLKANLILGETWLRSDREDEAASHLDVIRSLDPEGERPYQFMGDASPIPRTTVTIPALGEAAPPAPAEPEEVPTWLQEPEPVEEVAAPEVEAAISVPEVAPAVEEIAEETLVAQPPVEYPPAAVAGVLPPVPVEAAGVETAALPDWLQKMWTESGAAEMGVSAIEAAPVAPAAAPSPEEEIPSWLQESPEEIKAPEAALEEEVPAWLREAPAEAPVTEALTADAMVTEAPIVEIPTEEVPFQEAVPEEVAPTELEEEPAWLRILREEGLETELPSPEALAEAQALGEEAEMPSLEVAPTEGMLPQEKIEAGEVPAWLQTAWLQEGIEETQVSEKLAVEEPAQPRISQEQMLPVEEAAPAPVEVAEEEIPDWLREAVVQEPIAEEVGTAEVPVESLTAAEEAPAQAVAPIEPAAEEAEEEPAWLRILREEGLEVELPSEEALSEAGAVAAEAPAVEVSSLEIPAIEPFLASAAPVEAELAPAAEAPPVELPVIEPLPEQAIPVEAVQVPVAEAPPEAPPVPEKAPAQEAVPAEAAVEEAEEEPAWLRILRAEGLEAGLPSEKALAEAGLVAPEMATEMAETEISGGLPPVSVEEIEVGTPVEEVVLPKTTEPGWTGEPEPAWLRVLRGEEPELPSEEKLAVAGLVPEEAPVVAPEEAAAEEEMPAWLRKVALEEGLTPTPAPVQPLAALPVEAEAPAPEEPEGAGVEEEGDEMTSAWLRTLRQEGVAQSILPVEQPVDLKAEVVQPPEPTPAPQEEEIPPWLHLLRKRRGTGTLVLPEVGTARKAAPEGPSITEPAESWPVVDESILHGYEEVIQKDPQDHATRWKLAQAYASLGNHAAALEQGEQLVQRGELVDQVITYLEKTAGTGAETRQVYQLLGDAYFKTDRLDKAVDAYRKALTLLQ